MEAPKEQSKKISTTVGVVVAVVMLSVGLLGGYWAGYMFTSTRVYDLQVRLSTIQDEIDELQTKAQTTGQTQTNVSDRIDTLQNQLSNIRDQISSLQSSVGNTQAIDEINAEITSMQSQLTTLQNLVNEIKSNPSVTYENVTYYLGATSLSQLFEKVRDSVVTIQALIRYTGPFGSYFVTSQGSGYVTNFTGQMTVITCNHVVEGATSINVTFSNGNSYLASLKGADPTMDIAALTTAALQSEYKPLVVVNSSTLKVGDPVVVVGTPYGLEGSMSTGIVSATNRTIDVDQTTTMTNLIQTTAPLNPGNSGGPLIDYQGQVIGMATAIIQESQGIGLAIPSDAILQRVPAFF